MARHDYSPHEALGLLMQKLRERDEDLATEIQAAIDAGKDVEETEPTGRARKKTRSYRRAVRITDEEALRVATNALRAHFIEQPLFVESAADDFRSAAIDTQGGHAPRRPNGQGQAKPATGVDVEKILEIETQIETQISPADRTTLRLERASPEALAKQRENLDLLYDLIDFR